MPGQPALLISDYLIWGISVVGAGWLLVSLRDPFNRQRWQVILSRPAVMASFIVLLVYGLIALLDSLHYRPVTVDIAGEPAVAGEHYQTSEISVLDLLLTPIRVTQERSYSAPLALYVYSKEQLSTPAGSRYAYPRLSFGGAQLPDPAAYRRDLATRTAQGLGLALLLLTPIAMFFWRLSSRSRSTPKTEPTAAWGAAFATLAVLLILGLIAAQLADGYHLLGTDKVGQDVLYLGIKSIRTGVLIGTLTLLVMLPLALVMGTAAGYFGGRIDDAVQYLYTTLSSIPGVLLIAAAVLSVNLYLDQNLAEVTSLHQRADLRLLLLTGILGLTGWIGLCRLLRAESLKLRELDYVTAARAFGVRDLRILGRHLLPNLGHLVLITVVIDFSGLVLAEAVLSYVGVGVDPSMISWGNMINSARLELAREPAVWWSLATAFVFMFTLVLCANLFADAVRDALDPRLRGTQ